MQQQDSGVFRFGALRRLIAGRTTESWQNIPHISYVYYADITALHEAFEAFTKENAWMCLTFSTVMLKLITEGVKRAPKLNSHLNYNAKLVRGTLTQFDSIDVSVPFALADGSMLPVAIRDVGGKPLQALAEETRTLERRLLRTDPTAAVHGVMRRETAAMLRRGHPIRAAQRTVGGVGLPERAAEPGTKNTLTKEQLLPGTISVTSHSVAPDEVRGQSEMLMILPPQVCMFGLGCVRRELRVLNGEDGAERVETRSILPITICLDHRALDFGELRPFFRRTEELLNDPAQLFA